MITFKTIATAMKKKIFITLQRKESITFAGSSLIVAALQWVYSTDIFNLRQILIIKNKSIN